MYARFPPSEATFVLLEAAHYFASKNWMLGTSGNLSIRISGSDEPLEFMITTSGKDKSSLTPSDFVIVGVEGKPIDTPERKSSAETLIHGAIYQKLPWCRVVYHVHTVHSALASIYGLNAANKLSFSGLEMIKGLGFDSHEQVVDIPVLENTQNILALSQKIPHGIHPHVPGFLLKGHGLYAWGQNPFEARRHVEIWEYLFQYRLTELSLRVPSGPQGPLLQASPQ